MDLMGVSLAGLRLGLYTRHSVAVDADESLERQDEDGHDFAEAHGGTIAEVYIEKESAWKRRRVVRPDGSVVLRVIRPDYQRMLSDLRQGVIDGAVVYDLDRLTRDLRDLEDAIEVAEVYGRPIVGPGVDLTSPYGRANARAQAVAANKASQDTSRRVARKARQQQLKGVPTGSTRPFGWNADKRALHPVESVVVADGGAKLLAGVPVPALVREWNGRGLTGTRGARWQKTTLIQVYRNPRVCGLRGRLVETPNSRGQIAKRIEVVTRVVDGEPVAVRGQWEPILTVEEWRQILAVIGDRTLAERGANARRYLLTGILKCGLCGRGLFCRPPGGTVTGHTYYCRSSAQGGCGKVGRNGPDTEAHVLEAVFAKIELELSTARSETRPWPREAELTDITDKITETRAAWLAVPRRISSVDYFMDMEILRGQEKELTDDRDRHLASAARVAAQPANVRAEWDSYTLPHQRAILNEHLVGVVVHPAGKGRRAFNPDLLEIIWR